jgi:hypothetical protein
VVLLALAYWRAFPERRDDAHVQDPPTVSQETQRPLSLSSSQPIARSIERAARHFSGKPLRGDEGWFITQAAVSLGGDYPRWAAQLELSPNALRGAKLTGINTELDLWELRNLPLPELPALPAPTVDPAPAETAVSPSPTAEAQRLLDLLSLAVQCGKASTADRAELVEALRPPGEADLLVGQLWALSMASAQVCLTPEQLRELRPGLATRTYAELLGDSRMTDRTAARMAALCAAGACSWIPDAYFRRLVSHHRDAGIWHLEAVSQPHTENHVAALAFYALARRWQYEREH